MAKLESLFAAAETSKPELPRTTDNLILRELFKIGEEILQGKTDYLNTASHPSKRIENVDPIKSHGIYIHTIDGNIWLDLTNNWNTGEVDRLKHDELNDPELHRILGIMMLEKETPTEIGTWIQAAFVDKMRGFFAGSEADKENFQVLPVSAGTLAVDDAINLAQSLVGESKGIKPQNLRGIAYEAAFHGRHGEAAEATANKAKVGHKDHGFVTHIKAPVIQFNRDGSIDEKTTKRNFEESMDQSQAYLDRPDVAYIITEYPIQAEGGARVLHRDTLKALHDICTENEKVLIVDAVQMGGRTWYEDPKTGNVSPFAEEIINYADIIAFGKIFRACGTIANKSNIYLKGLNPEHIQEHPLEFGGTYTSNFAEMLSGAMIMSVILEKGLWKNAIFKTDEILSALRYFAGSFLGILTEPRGRPEDTAYLAWSFPESEMRNKFIELMEDNEHLRLLSAGERSVRLAPNPDMTSCEAKYIIAAIENQLRNL